jgi:hypothetical protein
MPFDNKHEVSIKYWNINYVTVFDDINPFSECTDGN